MKKRLYKSEELIEHMENKGIAFEITNKADAKKFLETNNYYMKLAAYRNNYEKHMTGKNKGKYINLEFAYLQELSRIDMELRYLILHMCLDIEHALKVKLLNSIENNENEDGYNIVEKLKERVPKMLSRIKQHDGSLYCKDIIQAYNDQYPVWVLVEVISFGDFTHLCALYEELYDEVIVNNKYLNSVRDIRNAAAHSNCLINKLKEKNNKPEGEVINYVKNIATIGKGARDSKLSVKFLYDFVVLLAVYDEIIPEGKLRDKRLTELNDLISVRCLRNKDYFVKNEIIKSAYSFVKKIVDNMISK